MKTLRKLTLILALIVSVPIYSASAQESNSASITELQSEWAKANYLLKGDEQLLAFEKLIESADISNSESPNDAGLQIWTGIIKSTFAGVKGGLGALKFAKAAKVHLEKSLKIDDQALNGSAYTSLGTLYQNVPGWPIGFGDNKKAKKFLLKAIKINPNGIDTNYFYADFLADNDDYSVAKQYFIKALAAEPRVGREVADEGRRREIQLALVDLEKHL